MSAGSFTLTKYAASYEAGAIHPISVQPETLSFSMNSISGPSITNDPPTGAVNRSISAKASKTRREIGLSPRKFRIEFTGALPTEYQSPVAYVTVLTEQFYQNVAVGATGTYLGSACVLRGKIPENTR